MFRDITNGSWTNAVPIFSIDRCDMEFLLTENSLKDFKDSNAVAIFLSDTHQRIFMYDSIHECRASLKTTQDKQRRWFSNQVKQKQNPKVSVLYILFCARSWNAHPSLVTADSNPSRAEMLKPLWSWVWLWLLSLRSLRFACILLCLLMPAY